jgi:hypothetical protein
MTGQGRPPQIGAQYTARRCLCERFAWNPPQGEPLPAHHSKPRRRARSYRRATFSFATLLRIVPAHPVPLPPSATKSGALGLFRRELRPFSKPRSATNFLKSSALKVVAKGVRGELLDRTVARDQSCGRLVSDFRNSRITVRSVAMHRGILLRVNFDCLRQRPFEVAHCLVSIKGVLGQGFEAHGFRTARRFWILDFGLRNRKMANRPLGPGPSPSMGKRSGSGRTSSCPEPRVLSPLGRPNIATQIDRRQSKAVPQMVYVV